MGCMPIQGKVSGSNYRPQRSWGKVIFSQASVILLTGGGCLLRGVLCVVSQHALRQTPPGTDTPGSRHPQDQTLPPDQTPPGTKHPPPPGPDTPHSSPDQTPSPLEQSMLRDTVNLQAVRILLECNLVTEGFPQHFTPVFAVLVAVRDRKKCFKRSNQLFDACKCPTSSFCWSFEVSRFQFLKKTKN